jgi:N-acetylglucosamine-6-phosphate deacetylase
MNKAYTLIENVQIVHERGILWDSDLLIKDGVIADFGKHGTLGVSADTYRIDAHGNYIGPGFIDIHVHEGDKYSTCHQTKMAAEFFLEHGTTSILATPVYTMDYDEFLLSIKEIKAAMPEAENVRGMYLEGPYMNPKYGAYADSNPWRHPIDEREYKSLVDEAGEYAKVWAIAPEREGILQFLEYAKKVNPDTVFAVGHSEALPEEIYSLGRYKPTLATHVSNATGRRTGGFGVRGCGPDEYCLTDPDMYAELICDSQGIHVRSDWQRLLIHSKGIHRVILITDSTYSECPNPPKYAHITDLSYDENGNIAGSKITMDQACKNIMTHTTVGIAGAFIMASTNAARLLGMYNERGSIERGKIADLTVVNDRFDVKNVILSGEVVK